MTEPPPPPAEVARRQRCRSLELAAVLGVVLAAVSLIDQTWPAVGVGLVGATVALVVRHRVCREPARKSGPRG
jgi:hypothetical protein